MKIKGSYGEKMEALKLENINSMWYFIVATLKAVVGSKGH